MEHVFNHVDMTFMIDLILDLSAMVLGLSGLSVLSLLEVLVNLVNEQRLYVDISVHLGLRSASFDGLSIGCLVTFAESFAMLDLADGIFSLEIQVTMFRVDWFRVVVAVFSSMESLFVVVILRLLDQKVMQTG